MHKTFLKRFLGFLPAVIIFPFMLWKLSGNFETLFRQTIEINPWLLFASAVLLFGHFTISGLGWWVLLHFFGGDLPPYQAVRISALAMLGRYIPGKIWTVASKIYMAHAKGVAKKITYIASVYEFILFNLSGFFIFLLMEAITPSGIVYLKSLFVTFVFLVILLFWWPNGVIWFLNHTLRLTRQAPVEKSLKRLQIFCIFLYYSCAWLIAGLSFYLFVQGIVPGMVYSQLTGALALASIVGFAVLLAPGGLGIREGVIAALLILSGVATDMAVFVSLCSRIWSTGGEILIVFPLYLIKGSELSKTRSYIE